MVSHIMLAFLALATTVLALAPANVQVAPLDVKSIAPIVPLKTTPVAPKVIAPIVPLKKSLQKDHAAYEIVNDEDITEYPTLDDTDDMTEDGHHHHHHHFKNFFNNGFGGDIIIRVSNNRFNNVGRRLSHHHHHNFFRFGGANLEGSTQSGVIFIWADDVRRGHEIRRVDFYDNTPIFGGATHIESARPYEFREFGFNTQLIPNGPRTMAVRIYYHNGQIQDRSVVYCINNGGLGFGGGVFPGQFPGQFPGVGGFPQQFGRRLNQFPFPGQPGFVQPGFINPGLGILPGTCQGGFGGIGGIGGIGGATPGLVVDPATGQLVQGTINPLTGQVIPALGGVLAGGLLPGQFPGQLPNGGLVNNGGVLTNAGAGSAIDGVKVIDGSGQLRSPDDCDFTNTLGQKTNTCILGIKLYIWIIIWAASAILLIALCCCCYCAMRSKSYDSSASRIRGRQGTFDNYESNPV